VTCLLPFILLGIALGVIVGLILALQSTESQRKSALWAFREAQAAELRALDREDLWRRMAERRNEGTGTP
jgi:hypothetical protein